MLLNNYWNLKYLCDVQGLEYGSAAGVYENGIKYENGNRWHRYKPFIGDNYNTARFDFCMKKNLFLELGSSIDTTIDPTQYVLNNRIDTSFTNYTCTYTTTVSENNKIKTIFTVGGVNNTSSAITITQVAIIKALFDYDRDNNTTYYTVLAINNLDDPITVPVGQGFSMVYEWTEQ